MKKPKILSDEEIAKAKNPILQESWVDFGQYVRGVTKEERAVAQKALDDCYKEMLGQFREWMKKHGHPSKDTWHWEIDREEYQVLLSQLEKG